MGCLTGVVAAGRSAGRAAAGIRRHSAAFGAGWRAGLVAVSAGCSTGDAAAGIDGRLISPGADQ